MSDTFIMSARQAAELDHALERNGLTPADVKLMSKGGTLGQFRKVLLGTATIVDKPVQMPKLLKSKGYFAAVRLLERHDPDAFYKTREGLYVTDDFRNQIVVAAKPTDAGGKWEKMRRFELTANATGTDLKSARPQGIWSATEFCPWLAAKLAKQPNGKAGELLNNGWATLFLVEGVGGEVFVVGVDWDSVGSEWRVRVWKLGDEWLAGHQFVPRN